MKRLNNLSILDSIKFVLVTLVAVTALNAQDVKQGIRLIDVEKYTEARNFFDNLIKSNPKNADAYYWLGKLDIKEGKTDQAQADFQKGIDANKENALNYVGIGQVQLIKNDSTSAIKQFDQALDMTDSKDANIMIAIADAYLGSDAKNFGRAIDLLSKAKTVSKKNPAIFQRLGDIYLRMVNGSLAIQNYQTAIDYDSANVKAHIGIGQIYAKIKNYADAEANFTAAITVDPSFAPAFKEFGEYYYSRKDYVKAADMYKKYIDFSEATSDKLERYATMLYLAKDYNTAITVINQVNQKGGKPDAQLQHVLAYSYFSIDDSQNGIAAFDKYFQMTDPKEITSTDYDYLGKLQVKAGNDSLAIENFKKAISLDSTRADLHGDIASLYFKNKKWDDAAKEYELKEKASGKPLKVIEYYNLGQAYYKMSNFKMADTTYAKMIQLSPDQPIGYYYRALSNAQLDPESEQGLAKPHYERFIEVVTKMGPEQQAKFKNHLIEAYSYLGYFYYLKKDNATSRQYWTKVLELDPTDAKAKEALKALK
ncbi:MAG: tetratricopeptide repeat protein [Ignavibacteria bacterium]|jgi:tetratricopeptide (TPR) repeat protein|nr:tetratricopeptide repeat protein [Ignavibacteria bacterium]MCU7504503.1 tetratricopeptide repeat protein [Ignavibacteria bacterium]MCU7517824.1 tetratricopeptide repeat protein [Ignavibacteria bacterium]